MAGAATTQSDQWEVVCYEAWMLFELCRLLESKDYDGSQVVKNAMVESACLHMRILVDILLSTDSGKSDDIRLNRLLPAFNPSSVDVLRRAYVDGNLSLNQQSIRWTLNKMIAHPTHQRCSKYDYTQILEQLLPLIGSVLQEIQAFQPTSIPKLQQPKYTVDPRMCAKTTS
jgi:hypothetical protein